MVSMMIVDDRIFISFQHVRTLAEMNGSSGRCPSQLISYSTTSVYVSSTFMITKYSMLNNMKLCLRGSEIFPVFRNAPSLCEVLCLFLQSLFSERGRGKQHDQHKQGLMRGKV